MNVLTTNSLKRTALAAAIVSTLALTGCSSSSDSATPAGNVTLSGTIVTAVDGYMVGCTVTDSTPTTAQQAFPVDPKDVKHPSYDATTAAGLTWASPGVYEFGPKLTPVGAINSSGCTDLSTGKSVPNLKTPAVTKGQKIVASPLAALVQAQYENALLTNPNATIAEASTSVATALELDTSLDLSTYDPMAGLNSTDPATQKVAAKAQAAATQIVNTVKAIEAATGDTSGAKSTSSFAALAKKVDSATTAAPLKLNDQQTLIDVAKEANGGVAIANESSVTHAMSTVNASIQTQSDAVQAGTTTAADFVKQSAAASIVADNLGTAITSSDTATLNAVTTASVDSDVVTETTNVNTDGTTSNTDVTPTTTVLCADDTTYVDVGKEADCPTGATT